MGVAPSTLSLWASVFCVWLVPCNDVSKDNLECFSSLRSPGCFCFELSGDVALRLDTGHCCILVTGTGRVLSILCCLNAPYGGSEDTEVGRGVQRAAVHPTPPHHQQPTPGQSCAPSSPSAMTPTFKYNLPCFCYHPQSVLLV